MQQFKVGDLIVNKEDGRNPYLVTSSKNKGFVGRVVKILPDISEISPRYSSDIEVEIINGRHMVGDIFPVESRYFVLKSFDKHKKKLFQIEREREYKN